MWTLLWQLQTPRRFHLPLQSCLPALIAFLLVVGCQGGGSGKATQEAFTAYREALAAGDMEALRKTLSTGREGSLESSAAEGMLEMIRAMAPPSPVIRETRVEGDSAFLTLEADWEGQHMEGSASLVRENGSWKMDAEHWKVELSLDSGGSGSDLAARLLADREAKPVKVKSWEAHAGGVLRAHFVPGGSTLATIGGDDNKLRLWDVESGALVAERDFKNSLIDMVLAQNGAGVVVGEQSGGLYWVPLGFNEWGEPKHFADVPGSITHIALSPDGSRVAVAVHDEDLQVYSVVNGSVEEKVKGSRSMRGVDYSPRGDFLAAGTNGNQFSLWALDRQGSPGKHRERTIPKVDPRSDVYCVAFSPNGKLLLTGHMDSSITLWKVDGAEAVQNFYVPGAATWDLAWYPDGSLYASAQQDGCLYLWDTETATPLAKLRAHEGAARTVAFSPVDWGLFASGGEDGNVALWR